MKKNTENILKMNMMEEYDATSNEF